MFRALKIKKYFLCGIIVFPIFIIPIISMAGPFSLIGKNVNCYTPPGHTPADGHRHTPGSYDTVSDTTPCFVSTSGPIGSKGVIESLISIITGPADGVVAIAVNLITSVLFLFFGLLLKLAGMLLNESIRLSVLNMHIFIGLEGVRVAWGIIRDIINIAFIFGIAYIAISTILQVAGNGIRELLVKLIIAALLVNFSFFFTGVLIDASNILTISLYEKVNEVTPLYDKTFDFSGAEITPAVSITVTSSSFDSINTGISGVFMDQTKISSIFRATESGGGGLLGYDTGPALGVAIFGSIFLFMLIFAFLTVAILFLMRLVVLIILIITSPIAYLSWAFPGLSAHSKQWWDTLWGQLIFAPAYMVMTLAIILVIKSTNFQNALGLSADNPGVGTSIISGFDSGTIAVVVNYLIIIGLLMASIIVSKTFASKGGTAVSQWVGKATGYVDSLRGVTSRNIFGRPSEYARKKLEGVRKDLDEGKRRGARGTRLALRALSTETGRKIIGLAEETKFGGVQSRKEVVRAEEDRIKEGIKKRAGKPKDQAAFIDNLDSRTQQKAVADMSAKNRAVLENELEKKWRAQTPPISDSEIKDRIEKLESRLSAEDKEKTGDERVKVKKVEQSKETREAVEAMASGTVAATTAFANLTDALNALPVADTYKLDDSVLTNHSIIDLLSRGQLDNIMRRSDLTPEQIGIIRDRILASGTADQRAYIQGDRVKHYWGT